jgi:hypothetical protein
VSVGGTDFDLDSRTTELVQAKLEQRNGATPATVTSSAAAMPVENRFGRFRPTRVQILQDERRRQSQPDWL